jgi:hypothetical protein
MLIGEAYLPQLPSPTTHAPLLDKTMKIESIIHPEVLSSHPCVGTNPSSTNRSLRGLFDIWGDIEHELLGLATMNDINKVHVNEGYIGKSMNCKHSHSRIEI